MDFFNILVETETHTIPKTWGRWISMVQEKNEKKQIFQIYELLKYFG